VKLFSGITDASYNQPLLINGMPIFKLLPGFLKIKYAMLCSGFFLPALYGAAQPETDLCLSGGANIGRHGFAEIGLVKRNIGDERHYSIGFVSYSVEFKPGKTFIIGPKIGVWGAAMSPLLIGVNMQVFSDFDKASLVFRPECGVALPFLKLAYGYNVYVLNHDFPGINQHNAAILFLLKLKSLKPRPGRRGRVSAEGERRL
jgi:hypothetical protein